MKRTIKISLSLTVLSGLLFLSALKVAPEKFQIEEVLAAAVDKDVIIIFNPGGWGDTSLEEAEDFAPIIEGIKSVLGRQGYSSIVVPYARTKNDFSSKLSVVKEFFNSFQLSSEDLSEKVEFLAEKLPDKKIIMAGLSNGASFVNETYAKLSGQVKGSVFAVAAGTPFWTPSQESNNILLLDNDGQDDLAEGKIGSLLLALVKTPFLKAFRAVGHDYSWSSPEVNTKVISFLEDKFH